MTNKKQTTKALEIILLERKGGKTSARILEELFQRPYNPNQMSNVFNISYNTASNNSG